MNRSPPGFNLARDLCYIYTMLEALSFNIPSCLNKGMSVFALKSGCQIECHKCDPRTSCDAETVKGWFGCLSTKRLKIAQTLKQVLLFTKAAS